MSVIRTVNATIEQYMQIVVEVAGLAVPAAATKALKAATATLLLKRERHSWNYADCIYNLVHSLVLEGCNLQFDRNDNRLGAEIPDLRVSVRVVSPGVITVSLWDDTENVHLCRMLPILMGILAD